MTQNEKPVQPAGEELDAETTSAIGGGGCTVGDLLKATEEFKQAYDNLVEFTSYVIERMAGGSPQ
jgi:hypothetical protein